MILSSARWLLVDTPGSEIAEIAPSLSSLDLLEPCYLAALVQWVSLVVARVNVSLIRSLLRLSIMRQFWLPNSSQSRVLPRLDAIRPGWLMAAGSLWRDCIHAPPIRWTSEYRLSANHLYPVWRAGLLFTLAGCLEF